MFCWKGVYNFQSNKLSLSVIKQFFNKNNHSIGLVWVTETKTYSTPTPLIWLSEATISTYVLNIMVLVSHNNKHYIIEPPSTSLFLLFYALCCNLFTQIVVIWGFWNQLSQINTSMQFWFLKLISVCLSVCYMWV